MSDLALMAASEWARTNTHTGVDPVKFGHQVALAYLACRDTAYHAGNEQATAVALSALSIPAEILQALALLASRFPGPVMAQGSGQTRSAGAGEQV